jgi:acyl-CoA thioester hydrolase
MNSNKQIQLAIRIDWSELDLFGHVNNVSFFKYIQSSRIHLWEKLDFKENGFMLASCSCKFIKPLVYPGNVKVNVSVDFIKNSSFGLHHQLINDQNEIVAEASDVLVLFDFVKNEKVTISDALRTQLEELS